MRPFFADAVVVYWPELLLLVGPYGDWISWPVPPGEELALAAETDGVRLISATTHELLRRVPDSTAQVRPGCSAR